MPEIATSGGIVLIFLVIMFYACLENIFEKLSFKPDGSFFKVLRFFDEKVAKFVKVDLLVLNQL